MRFSEPSESGRAAARGALLLAALILWLPAAAQAQAPVKRILVSNTGQTQSAMPGFRSVDVAQGFRTGMNPDGYVLSSLELFLRQEASGVAISNLTVTLRNASGNNPGSRVLATFVNPNSPALSTTGQTFRFTLSKGEVLDRDTPYFIHLSNDHASGFIRVGATEPDNQDSGGLNDWGIDDNGKVFDSSNTWSNISGNTVIKIQIRGYAKTPPVQVPGGRILVSNTGQTQSAIPGFRSVDVAQGFRTGMNPDGYVLSSLELFLRQEASGVAMSNLTVTLRNASGNNPGSRVLATFENPDSPALSDTGQMFRFTLFESEELNLDTPYFIYLSNNHAFHAIGLAGTLSDNQDSGSLNDWEIDDSGKVFDSSNTWSNISGDTVVKIQLRGYAKTPPVLITAEVDGDELVLTYGEALDVTLVPAAAAFTVTVGGTAVSVSTVTVAGVAVTLDLASAVAVGQTVLLDYVVPSSNPLQNGFGVDARALAGQMVENRTLAAPSALSAPSVSAVSGQSDRLSVSWTAPSDGGLRDHGLRRAVLPGGGGGVHGGRRLHRARLHRNGDGGDDRDADGVDGVPGAGAGDQRRGYRAVVAVGVGFDGDADADGGIRRRVG